MLGVNDPESSISFQDRSTYPSGIDLEEYLIHNISYVLDSEKKRSMDFFFTDLRELKTG